MVVSLDVADYRFPGTRHGPRDGEALAEMTEAYVESIPASLRPSLLERYRRLAITPPEPTLMLEMFNAIVDRSAIGQRPGCLGVFYPPPAGRRDDAGIPRPDAAPNHGIYYITPVDRRADHFIFDFNDGWGRAVRYHHYAESTDAVVYPFNPIHWRRFGADGNRAYAADVNRPLRSRARVLNSEQYGVELGVCSVLMCCAQALIADTEMQNYSVGSYVCGAPGTYDRIVMVGYLLHQPALTPLMITLAAFGPPSQWLRVIDQSRLPPVGWRWLCMRADIAVRAIGRRRRRVD